MLFDDNYRIVLITQYAQQNFRCISIKAMNKYEILTLYRNVSISWVKMCACELIPLDININTVYSLLYNHGI